jgi:prolyl oligopeptidase
MLNNVRGELRRYTFADGRWTFETVPAPELGSIGINATSPLTNRYFFSYSGYTQPTTLYVADEDGAVREVRRLPAMFDAAELVVEQHEATRAMARASRTSSCTVATWRSTARTRRCCTRTAASRSP